MPRSLFRKEAIDAQRQKFLGEASIAQPVRLWVYTTVALIIAALVIAYAIWGQYTRRERVQGYLTSAVGAALVKMPDAGSVSELMIKEGDAVTKGAPLARLTVDRSGTNTAGGEQAVLDELVKRKKQLTDERTQTEQLGRQQVEQLRKRLVNTQDEMRQLDVQVNLQIERFANAKKLLDIWEALKVREGEKFANESYIIRYRNEAKDQEIAVQTLERQRATLKKNLDETQSDIPAARLKTQSQLEQLGRQESEVDQSIAEQANRREQNVRRDMLVVAPVDGTVTNIGVARGDTVSSDATLATILPKDSDLHAELLVPSRAIGFVEPGQRVTMRYEAFPYERFGQYAGTVESVGRNTFSQAGTIGPITIREPSYRIVVRLDRQDIDANGQAIPLRAGMVLGADLLMEKRSLLEWLFLPAIQFFERTRSPA